MKYMMKRILPFGLFFLLSLNMAYGQDLQETADLETWTSMKLRVKPTKKFSLYAEQAFRFDDNSAHLNSIFTELGVGYKLNKHWSFGTGYRLIRDEFGDGATREQRFQVDAKYRHGINRFKLNYRLRYQSSDIRGISSADGDVSTQKIRLRTGLAYNIRKWPLDPYFSVEGFFARENQAIQYIDEVVEQGELVSGFEKLRFTLGTSYKLKKFGEIGGFYRIEQGFSDFDFDNVAKTTYILGVNYTYTIK